MIIESLKKADTLGSQSLNLKKKYMNVRVVPFLNMPESEDKHLPSFQHI